MPKQLDNVVMRNTQGKFGDQVVFRVRKGKTIVSKPPRFIPRDATPGQEAAQLKFGATIRYGKAAMQNLPLKKEYDAAAVNGQTAFNVACRDAHIAPEVHEINTTLYNGALGSIISIVASDDFKVAKVDISIRDAADVLLEEGTAIFNNGIWNYMATTANANLAGTKITATAYDLPNNKGELEITL